MSTFGPAETLRQHRPVLLACEAIGWLHMAGKARMEFLRKHGGDKVQYDDSKWHDAEQPPFPWNDLIGWVRTFSGSAIPQKAWPSSIEQFTEKYRDRNPGLLGLLQAGHGMASGIEKNLTGETSKYLGQLLPHMWLSSPFGHPKRNLFADPPEVLSARGWQQLVAEMERVLEKLRDLTSQKPGDVLHWRQWRDQAIGPGSYIREAFLSTLAETRLPNNDVTLWDQSYVAAALFKSAVAGAALNASAFPWNDNIINRKTRWRLLTVAIGADHYEARSVKIGDWTGTRAVLDEFFSWVAQLVEVDLAVGALLYRDSSTVVFSFPGERFDEEAERKKTEPNFKYDEECSADWLKAKQWKEWVQREADRIAECLRLETPPLVRLSRPTRSLVPMVQERGEAAKVLAVPVHRPWNIRHPAPSANRGHVCPVCRVRLSGDPTSKARPCTVCRERRHHRLADWLLGCLSYPTIWFEEVADDNNRIALLTFSLDLAPWLEGKRVDSLRTQAIPEWVRFNPTLVSSPNPIAPNRPWEDLRDYIKSKLPHWNENDPVLTNLQEGFKHHASWQEFFERIVEDRSDAPDWHTLNDDQRAAWLTHQLFRKLPSPGRVYRFWRESQEFFEELLTEFRQIAARTENPWLVRRLLIVPDQSRGNKDWADSTVYNAHFRGAPFSLVYVSALNGFVTTSNLARFLRPHEDKSVLNGQTVLVEEEDTFGKVKTLVIGGVREIPTPYSHLGVYHPVIPVEVSPLRFRSLLPLRAASECVDHALHCWKERFSMVWDRLPLHVGIVAFERALSFQAVLEATRNLENKLTGQGEEWWRIESKEVRNGVVAIQLVRPDTQRLQRTLSLQMPDGREDLFYPYLRVEDRKPRFPRDFLHPHGSLYRHVADVRIGEGVFVVPARIGAIFMDSTAARFESLESWYADDWERMRSLWYLLQRVAPSQTALQRFWSAIQRVEREWAQGPDQVSADLGRDTARALLVEHLEAKGTALDELTEAAAKHMLQRAIKWHLTALKETL